VRRVIRDQNVTDDEVIAVLQCFDLNVDEAVAALREGLKISLLLTEMALSYYYYCPMLSCMSRCLRYTLCVVYV